MVPDFPPAFVTPQPKPGAQPIPAQVLLVEDDPAYAKWVRRALEKSGAGFQVEQVGRLDEALERLEQGPVDAVLLDLSLPDGYGAFTVASACAMAHDGPVLVLTGSEDPRLIEASRRAGARDYLVKDQVDRRALPEMVLRAIRDRGEGHEEPDGRAARGRSSLHRRLARAAANSSPPESVAAVLVVEFDDMPLLDELFGPRVCEEVLHCAGRLLDAERSHGPAFQPIGDSTFAAVIEGVQSEAAVARVCGEVLQALGEIQLIEPGGIGIQGLTASVGVAVYPWDGASPSRLVENAHAAQRTAAAAGGSRTRFHHQGEALVS